MVYTTQDLNERRRNIERRLSTALTHAEKVCRLAQDATDRYQQVLKVIQEQPPVVFVQVVDGQLQVKQVSYDHGHAICSPAPFSGCE